MLEEEFANGNITEEIYRRTLGHVRKGFEEVPTVPTTRGNGNIEQGVGSPAESAGYGQYGGKPELKKGEVELAPFS